MHQENSRLQQKPPTDTSTTEDRDNHAEIFVRMPSLEEEREVLKKYLPDKNFTLEELHENRENTEVFMLQYGSKVLLLYCNQSNRAFSTVIANIDGRKMERETTLLYQKALVLMRNMADRTQQRFNYEMATKNERMAHWAQTNGKEIFDWKTITPPQRRWRLDIYHPN